MMQLVKTRLVSANVPRLARFYSRVTGLAAVGSDEYTELRTRAGTLAICSLHALEVCGRGSVVIPLPHTGAVSFQVADVDAEWRRVRVFVPEMLMEPTTQPWGNRAMMFRDPDGNLITFFTPSHPE